MTRDVESELVVGGSAGWRGRDHGVELAESITNHLITHRPSSEIDDPILFGRFSSSDNPVIAKPRASTLAPGRPHQHETSMDDELLIRSGILEGRIAAIEERLTTLEGRLSCRSLDHIPTTTALDIRLGRLEAAINLGPLDNPAFPRMAFVNERSQETPKPKRKSPWHSCRLPKLLRAGCV